MTGTQTRLGKVMRTECPKNCGWRREWNQVGWWLDRRITHPVYGEIANGRLVLRDIEEHNCIQHLKAVARRRSMERTIGDGSEQLP